MVAGAAAMMWAAGAAAMMVEAGAIEHILFCGF